MLSPNCPFASLGHIEDLSYQRLIGFKTTVADYSSIRNIRVITPIVDTKDPCLNTWIRITAVQDMTGYISKGSITRVIDAPDVASQGYGKMDGFTKCGSRTYSLDQTIPGLSLVGNTLTLESSNA